MNIIKTFVAATALAITSTSAFATCGYRDVVITTLISKHGERLRLSGYSNSSEAVLEVYVNDETGSFSAVVTTANGISCLTMAGISTRIFTQEDDEPAGEEM